MKQTKKLTAQLKEAVREAEEARSGREEASTLAREAERRVKALEAEALQHAEELAAVDRARRHAEAERDDKDDELTATGAKVDKRKFFLCYLGICGICVRPC